MFLTFNVYAENNIALGTYFHSDVKVMMLSFSGACIILYFAGAKQTTTALLRVMTPWGDGIVDAVRDAGWRAFD